MTTRFAAVLFAICVTFFVACTTDEVSKPTVVALPTTTAIPLPGSLAREQSRNEIVNEAIRFATAGCPGIGERLSGHPTRVMAALTNSRAAGRLTNPEADFQDESGPGGIGVTVWVLVIEGSSIPVFGKDPWDGTNVRSFVFVIRTGVRELTGCVVRDAPMPTKYKDLLVDGFEFEVLFGRQ